MAAAASEMPNKSALQSQVRDLKHALGATEARLRDADREATNQRFKDLEHSTDLALEAAKDAAELVRTETDRRLLDLNHVKAESIADRQNFVRADTYTAAHRELAQQVQTGLDKMSTELRNGFDQHRLLDDAQFTAVNLRVDAVATSQTEERGKNKGYANVWGVALGLIATLGWIFGILAAAHVI